MSRSIALVSLFTLSCSAVLGLDNEYVVSEGAGSEGLGGAASSSGAGSGGAGSGGAGSGGVGIGPEDCSDGIDNDGDGAVDCADTPECDPVVECVSVAPSGWAQYARFTREAFPSSGPPGKCPDGSEPLVHYAGPSTAATQCSACSCTWPGAACSAPEISCWKGTANCAGASDLTTKATNTACISVANFVSAEDASCKVTGAATVVNPGTCTLIGGELSPAWDEVIYVCLAPPSPDQSGCEAGEACVPKGGGAFGGAACAARSSAEPCPAGWAASGVISYGGDDDTRSCGACACETGVSCMGGSYLVQAFNDCTGSMVVVDSATCKDVTDQLDNNAGSVKATLAQVVPGTCGGGAPSGSLKEKDPLTICCP